MRNVVIVDGVRTAFGKLGGSLRQFPMSHLAAMAIDGLLDKTQILEKGGKVEGVYMGSALHDNQTHAPARFAVLKSKLGYDVWSSYIERQCGSAIDSMDMNKVVGTLAGDDTVMVVMRDNNAAAAFCGEIKSLIER